MTIKPSDVVEILKEVKDVDVNVDIVALGLIYGIKISDKIEIEMTLTSPFCPHADFILNEAEGRVRKKFGVETNVSLTFTPEWSPNFIDEETRFALDIDLSQVPNDQNE